MVDVVIKPTTRCNLKCLYCNVEKIFNADISIPVLKDFFSFLVKSFPEEEIVIKWHGGEPLLMGLDFFKSSIEYQNKISSHFENEILTNITLLNKQWLEFLKEGNFEIYTSLDSIGCDHDIQRSGSSEIVRQALIDLKSFGINNVTVKTTITKYNLNNIERVLEFCDSLQFKWNFSQAIPSGIQQSNTENIIVNPTDFNNAIIGLFDKWFVSESPSDISQFKYIIDYIIHKETYGKKKPALSLGPDGNIYACPSLIGNLEYIIGKFDNPASLEKFNNVDCSCNKIYFPECKNCYFDFFCKITYCEYLNEVHKGFFNLPNYVCSCWKPILTHIREQVTLQMGFAQNSKVRNF